MQTTDFILKELCNVIDFDKHYASWDDVQMTVSMPQIVELVNRAIKQEREACSDIADSWSGHYQANEIAEKIRARENT